MTTRLRLGPLPSTQTVKMTITVSAELKAGLDRYTELYTQEWGVKADAIQLIPFMLESFMASDRAFQRARPKAATPTRHPRRDADGL